MIPALFSSESLNSNLVLRRLMLLRILIWLFAFAASIFDHYILQQGLPLKGFLAIIFIGFCYSGVSHLRLRNNTLVTDRELFFHLIIDSILILALVLISGRTANPFIYYLLVLIAINSVLFNKRSSWTFTFFAITSYTIMLYLDIKDHVNHLLNDFQLHLLGMWVNFVGSALLINFFVSNLATALRDREILLAQAREESLKNEQLVGIGTIAASTAHALRTPLSTMAVLLSDIRSESDSANFIDDVDLLLKQIDRCKQTINKLAVLAEMSENERSYEKPSELLSFLEEHYLLINPHVKPEFLIGEFAEEFQIQENILLRQAILNLIDNAIEAAKTRVVVKLEKQAANLAIQITDDGEGIPDEIIKNWGTPFLSKKENGLGIGIFLSNSTIERLGGKITLTNTSPDKNKGTVITITIPSVEVDIEESPS